MHAPQKRQLADVTSALFLPCCHVTVAVFYRQCWFPTEFSKFQVEGRQLFLSAAIAAAWRVSSPASSAFRCHMVLL